MSEKKDLVIIGFLILVIVLSVLLSVQTWKLDNIQQVPQTETTINLVPNIGIATTVHTITETTENKTLHWVLKMQVLSVFYNPDENKTFIEFLSPNYDPALVGCSENGNFVESGSALFNSTNTNSWFIVSFQQVKTFQGSLEIFCQSNIMSIQELS
ncbi:MAG: hypothetical protein KGJ90_06895 [Patescibacteria group bacterium]|nr:hypothetical protein [Patescibacteria group bacterium]